MLQGILTGEGKVEVKYIAFLLLGFFRRGDLRQNKAFQLLSGFDIYLGIVFFLSPVSIVSTNIIQNIPQKHNSTPYKYQFQFCKNAKK